MMTTWEERIFVRDGFEFEGVKANGWWQWNNTGVATEDSQDWRIARENTNEPWFVWTDVEDPDPDSFVEVGGTYGTWLPLNWMIL